VLYSLTVKSRMHRKARRHLMLATSHDNETFLKSPPPGFHNHQLATWHLVSCVNDAVMQRRLTRCQRQVPLVDLVLCIPLQHCKGETRGTPQPTSSFCVHLPASRVRTAIMS
jgi:hypothetical protein